MVIRGIEYLCSRRGVVYSRLFQFQTVGRGVLYLEMFLLRVTPYEDEDISSFLIRLASRNYYPSYFQLCKRVGLTRVNCPINLSMIIDQNISFKRLSNLSLVDEDKLIHLTFFYEFGSDKELKHKEVNTIFRFALKTKYIQVCPICLKEAKYFRKRWSIGFYTCCHIHSCLMVCQCSNCGEKIRLNHVIINECKCGFDLSTSPVSFIDEKETEFSELISTKRLNSLMQDTTPLNQLLS